MRLRLNEVLSQSMTSFHLKVESRGRLHDEIQLLHSHCLRIYFVPHAKCHEPIIHDGIHKFPPITTMPILPYAKLETKPSNSN